MITSLVGLRRSLVRLAGRIGRYLDPDPIRRHHRRFCRCQLPNCTRERYICVALRPDRPLARLGGRGRRGESVGHRDPGTTPHPCWPRGGGQRAGVRPVGPLARLRGSGRHGDDMGHRDVGPTPSVDRPRGGGQCAGVGPAGPLARLRGSGRHGDDMGRRDVGPTPSVDRPRGGGQCAGVRPVGPLARLRGSGRHGDDMGRRAVDRIPALVGRSGWVDALAFDPKGRWLASGGADGTVKVWDTAAWEARASLTVPTAAAVTDVHFLEEARCVTLHEGDTLRLWEVPGGEESGTFREFGKIGAPLRLSGWDRFWFRAPIAAATSDGRLFRHNLQSRFPPLPVALGLLLPTASVLGSIEALRVRAARDRGRAMATARVERFLRQAGCEVEEADVNLLTIQGDRYRALSEFVPIVVRLCLDREAPDRTVVQELADRARRKGRSAMAFLVYAKPPGPIARRYVSRRFGRGPRVDRPPGLARDRAAAHARPGQVLELDRLGGEGVQAGRRPVREHRSDHGRSNILRARADPKPDPRTT